MVKIINNKTSVLDVDWTSTVGETPFYENSSSDNPGRYCVSVDTGVLKYTELLAINKETLIEKGVDRILEYYNKGPISDYSEISASIPGSNQQDSYGVEGAYIPIRPNDNIKVLVTIEEKFFENIPDRPVESIAAYDEIQINTYGLQKKI